MLLADNYFLELNTGILFSDRHISKQPRFVRPLSPTRQLMRRYLVVAVVVVVVVGEEVMNWFDRLLGPADAVSRLCGPLAAVTPPPRRPPAAKLI